MTNEVMVIDGFQVPSYIKNLAPVENDFGRAGGLPSIAPFSTTTFKIKVEDQEKVVAAPLPVVILGITPKGTANSRAYYQEQYVEGQITAPDCASSDGIAPDEGDKRQSTTCATCPKAVFGSADGDRKGQACSQQKTLFVVPANKLDSVVYQIRVAPTSLKAVATYGTKLTNTGLHFSTVITSLGLIPETESQKSYPILKLSIGGFLNEEQGMVSVARSKSPEIQSLITTPPTLITSTQTAAPEPQVSEGFEPPETEVVYQAPEEQPAPQQAALAGFGTDPGAAHLDKGLDPETGEKLDITGARWNADLHSSGKTMLQDGTWRKKAKGKKTSAAAGPTAAEREAEAHRQAAMAQSSGAAGGQDPLTDALGEWG